MEDDGEQQGGQMPQGQEPRSRVVVTPQHDHPNLPSILGRLLRFTLFAALTFLVSFSVNLSTQIALGHLSAKALAAGSLGTIVYNFTGLSLVNGLLSAQDTLGPQAFGANDYPTVGVVLQRSIVVVITCLTPVSLAWVNAEALLIALKQPPEVAAMAAHFLTIMLGALVPMLGFEALKRFLQAQGVFRPMIYSAGLAMVLHPILLYVLIFKSSLGFYGGPVANVISAWVTFLSLLGFTLVVRPHHPLTWPGFSSKAFQKWGQFLKLGIPGAAAICLEWWGFEILTLRAGAIDTVSLAAMNVLSTIVVVCFMVTLGIAVSGQTIVGNSLGAGHHRTARSVAFAAVILAMVVGAGAGLLVYLLRHQIAPVFTNDDDVIAVVQHALPVMCAFISFDACQGACQGVMRGAGKQHFSALLMIVWVYGVSLPCAFTLGGKDGVRGIWIGTSIGYVGITIFVFVLLWCVRWDKIAAEVRKRTEAAPAARDEPRAKQGKGAAPGPSRSKAIPLHKAKKPVKKMKSKDELVKGRDSGLANQDEMMEEDEWTGGIEVVEEIELGEVPNPRVFLDS